MDEYRKIRGFPYSVSSKGDIRNERNGYVLKPVLSSGGYYRVRLWLNGRAKNFLVHRLVAKAFVQNPNQKPEVNHKDGDKSNNCAENLEWVTGAENKRHSREVLGKVNRNPNTEAAHNACKKRVRCIDLDVEYESITEAAKAIAVSQSTLSNHLIGKNKTCKGLHFEFIPKKGKVLQNGIH